MTSRALALAVAIALGAAGCGADKNGPFGGSSSRTAAPATQGAATDTPASRLRATLTALLTDHAYLSGIAVSTGLASGFDSAGARAARGTLQRTRSDLADVVSSVYGTPAGDELKGILRRQAAALTRYARAQGRGDKAAAQSAQRKLDGSRTALGTFVARYNPNLSADVVAAALAPQAAAARGAVDAVAHGSPTVFSRLQQSAAAAPPTAATLAGAIVKQFPTKFPGAADDAPATLRASLTALLTDHVYLAGITIATGVGSGLTSPAVKAAAAALDANSVALSKMIGSVYGAGAATRFLALWRAHIGYFIDYTKAQLAHDAAAAQQALAHLDGYRRAFGTLMASANPNLTAPAVAGALKAHVASMTAVIRAAVKRSPKAFDRLREAAGHMPATADVLATAIAKQFPDRFPAA